MTVSQCRPKSVMNSARTLSPNPKCISSSEQILETSDRYSSFLNPLSLAGAIVEKETEIASLLAMAHKIRAMLYAAGPRPFSIPNVYAIIKEFIST